MLKYKCLPVTVSPLLPTLGLPAARALTATPVHVRCLNGIQGIKKIQLFSIYTNIHICTVQTANHKCGFNRTYIFFKSSS